MVKVPVSAILSAVSDIVRLGNTFTLSTPNQKKRRYIPQKYACSLDEAGARGGTPQNLRQAYTSEAAFFRTMSEGDNGELELVSLLPVVGAAIGRKKQYPSRA